VVQTFPSYRSDQALCARILPRALRLSPGHFVCAPLSSCSIAIEEDARVSITPVLYHRLKPLIDMGTQSGPFVLAFCLLTLKGNGGGSSGHTS